MKTKRWICCVFIDCGCCYSKVNQFDDVLRVHFLSVLLVLWLVAVTVLPLLMSAVVQFTVIAAWKCGRKYRGESPWGTCALKGNSRMYRKINVPVYDLVESVYKKFP